MDGWINNNYINERTKYYISYLMSHNKDQITNVHSAKQISKVDDMVVDQFFCLLSNYLPEFH